MCDANLCKSAEPELHRFPQISRSGYVGASLTPWTLYFVKEAKAIQYNNPLYQFPGNVL